MFFPAGNKGRKWCRESARNRNAIQRRVRGCFYETESLKKTLWMNESLKRQKERRVGKVKRGGGVYVSVCVRMCVKSTHLLGLALPQAIILFCSKSKLSPSFLSILPTIQCARVKPTIYVSTDKYCVCIAACYIIKTQQWATLLQWVTCSLSFATSVNKIDTRKIYLFHVRLGSRHMSTLAALSAFQLLLFSCFIMYVIKQLKG